MLAGRPHETAGNGSPRWMTAASRPREGTEPGLQADSPPFIPLTCMGAVGRSASSVTVPPERDGTRVPRLSARRTTLTFFAPVRRPGIMPRA